MTTHHITINHHKYYIHRALPTYVKIGNFARACTYVYMYMNCFCSSTHKCRYKEEPLSHLANFLEGPSVCAQKILACDLIDFNRSDVSRSTRAWHSHERSIHICHFSAIVLLVMWRYGHCMNGSCTHVFVPMWFLQFYISVRIAEK